MMRIRSAEIIICCASCPAMLKTHFQMPSVYLESDEFEVMARMECPWATDEDPSGETCVTCQREAIMAERADNERRERCTR